MPFSTTKSHSKSVKDLRIKQAILDVAQRKGIELSPTIAPSIPSHSSEEETISLDSIDLPEFDLPQTPPLVARNDGKGVQLVYKTEDVTKVTDVKEIHEVYDEVVKPSRDELREALRVSHIKDGENQTKSDDELLQEIMRDFILYVPANYKRHKVLRETFWQIICILYKYQYCQGIGIESQHGLTRAFIASRLTKNKRKDMQIALVNGEKIGIIKSCVVNEKVRYYILRREAELVQKRMLDTYSFEKI